MIKVLKLQKAIYAILLGVVALIAAQVMKSNRVDGSGILLAVSGVCLILGAGLFVYPVLFAKKVDKDGEEVELTPISTETEEEQPH